MAEVEAQRPVAAATTNPKRKRKSGSSGAKNDCFACLKVGQSCDRVRPYCGQCLLKGQECSGYKTDLTWNVGVASRGKLRGKTLPVHKASEAAQLPQSAPRPQDVRARMHSLPSGQKGQVEDGTAQSANKRQRLAPYFYPHNDGRHYSQDAYANGFNHNNNMFAQPQWQDPRRASFQSYPQYPYHRPPDPHMHTLQPLQTVSSYYPDGTSMSPSTSSPVSAAPYQQSPYDTRNQHVVSPREQDQPRMVGPFTHANDFPSFRAPGHRPILNNYDPRLEDAPPPPTPNVHNHDRRPSRATANGDAHQMPLESPWTEKAAFSFLWGAEPMPSGSTETALVDEEDTEGEFEGSSTALQSLRRSSFDIPFSQVPRRMQIVLDYYNSAICPFLVAVDGPANPYRKYILQMAVQSPGLQNAIAALVSNNRRMRQIAEPSDFKDISLTRDRRSSIDLVSSPGVPTNEEQHYKSESISYLNASLTSGNKDMASSDTVLASLLILCLYHVCNSGFSKFKTQLAGVQKVLRMRRQNSRSTFSSWVELFFAWLDVMTSAVNDRETEIKGDTLDMSNLNSNLGPLEEFSGCDGRLFKIIARLGRLNLLSQNRPVKEPEVLPTTAMVDDREASPSSTDFGKDFYAPSFDADVKGTAPNYNSPRSPALAETKPSIDRQAFWKEWKDIRTRLRDRSIHDSMKDTRKASSPIAQAHMVHLSEAFRFSALLYIERLAHPELPSSSPDLQDLVEDCLSHIEEIGEGSCVTKFMLWPLFVTGTECIQERHRDLIRARCVEIQKESGFFNNVTGLRVLERVWRESDADTQGGGAAAAGKAQQAFKWRAAMDRLDGEYIVI